MKKEGEYLFLAIGDVKKLIENAKKAEKEGMEVDLKIVSRVMNLVQITFPKKEVKKNAEKDNSFIRSDSKLLHGFGTSTSTDTA